MWLHRAVPGFPEIHRLERGARPLWHSFPSRGGSARFAPGLATPAVVLGLSAFLLLPITAHGQEPSSLAVDPTCTDRPVRMEHLVTLGESGAGQVSATFAVERGSDWYYVVPSPWIRHEIHVFDRAGAFVRSVGRRGGGPGEYRYIRALHVTPGDTVHVFDVEHRRWTVLSADFEVLRTNRLPGHIFDGDVIRLADGRLVLNSRVPSPESAGLPLHLLDRDGTLLRSFGARRPSVTLGQDPLTQRRSLALSGDGAFWAAHTVSYTIERWDTAGTRLQELRRDAPWFDASSDGEPTAGEPTPPPTILLDLAEDGDGQLWVVGRAVDPEWRSAVQGNSIEYGRYADTVVEVFDVETTRLLTSCRLPWFMAGFLDGSTLYTYCETAGGLPVLDVWRVRLEPSTGRLR